jgi:hypothetical protein
VGGVVGNGRREPGAIARYLPDHLLRAQIGHPGSVAPGASRTGPSNARQG